MGLPGLGLGESVIPQSTPAPSRRCRQQTSHSCSALIMKQPTGLKASSPLLPPSPVSTSPFPSSRTQCRSYVTGPSVHPSLLIQLLFCGVWTNLSYSDPRLESSCAHTPMQRQSESIPFMQVIYVYDIHHPRTFPSMIITHNFHLWERCIRLPHARDS